MKEKRKRIDCSLPKEEKDKLLWFEKSGWAKVVKILTGIRVGDPIMAEAKSPSLSFGQYVVGSLFFMIRIFLIIFALLSLPVIFSGK